MEVWRRFSSDSTPHLYLQEATQEMMNHHYLVAANNVRSPAEYKQMFTNAIFV